MPKRKAVTHADLEPSHPKTDLGSKVGAFCIVFTILCGLFFFILCLISEATRSKTSWVGSSIDKGKGRRNQCVYSGSGKTPLLCGASAFVGLAIVMVVEHTHMLIAISKLPAFALSAWDPNSTSETLTWQAGLFFIASWISFGVGEILLLIGLSVESGHLKNWFKPKPSCLVLRQGLFFAAGVFGLTSVFFAAGLYLTALRVQRISLGQKKLRREVLAASVLYASPPRSPRHRMSTVTRENPIQQPLTLSEKDCVVSKELLHLCYMEV